MRVNVYASNDDRYYGGSVVARVQNNRRLDMWTGSNWQNGGVGLHLGITKLRDGRYVLIHGTQWDGERDYGLIVTDREALDAILSSDNAEVLEDPRFRSLKELAETVLVPEHA